MKKSKTQKGITLIALIITIIVLLILAVVAISAIQNDGIIEYAKNARDEYQAAQEKEDEMLANYLTQIEENLPNGNNGEGTGDTGSGDSDTDTGIVHNGIIPEGGTYIVGGYPDEENGYGWISGTTVYSAGAQFPETVTIGDVYKYGDYAYYYGYSYDGGMSAYFYLNSYEGWGVELINRNSEEVSVIITTINGADVTGLNGLFYDSKIKYSPAIPHTVIDMDHTFGNENSGFNQYTLEVAPDLSKCTSLKYMNGTFDGCTSLKTYEGSTDEDYDFTNYVIPSSVTTAKSDIFSGCSQLTY